MAARVLDGRFVRDQLLAEARPRVEKLPRRPGIAVVLVGHNPASEVYVRNKVKACEETGVYSEKYTPGDDASTAGQRGHCHR